MLLAAAPFTPAVMVSFFMLLIAGVYGINGYIQTSLVLLLINTLSVIGSPIIDISNITFLILVLVIFPMSFGGIILGVRKSNTKI